MKVCRYTEICSVVPYAGTAAKELVDLGDLDGGDSSRSAREVASGAHCPNMEVAATPQGFDLQSLVLKQ